MRPGALATQTNIDHSQQKWGEVSGVASQNRRQVASRRICGECKMWRLARPIASLAELSCFREGAAQQIKNCAPKARPLLRLCGQRAAMPHTRLALHATGSGNAKCGHCQTRQPAACNNCMSLSASPKTRLIVRHHGSAATSRAHPRSAPPCAPRATALALRALHKTLGKRHAQSRATHRAWSRPDRGLAAKERSRKP